MVAVNQYTSNAICYNRAFNGIMSVGLIFGWVWWTQTIRGARGGYAHFTAKMSQKIKIKK